MRGRKSSPLTVFIIMINFKNNYNKNEKLEIQGILAELNDPYKDFYLNIDNKRIFVKENTNEIFKLVKKGDKLMYTKDGVLIITGFNDNSSKNYLKLLGHEKQVNDLLKCLAWNLNIDLYVRMNIRNPIVSTLFQYGFYKVENDKDEILLRRNKREIRNVSHK